MLETGHEYIEEKDFFSGDPEQQAALFIQAMNRINNLENENKELKAADSMYKKLYEKNLDLRFQGQHQNERLTICLHETIEYAFKMPKPKEKCARKSHLKWLKKMKNTYYEYKLIPGIYDFKGLL